MAGSADRASQWLVRRWRQPTFLSRLLLWPPAGLFALLTMARRFAYRRGWFAVRRVEVPVVVVGNLTVGGSGKTPLVVHLVEALRRAGWSPGVVSRGYGGQGGAAHRIEPDATAAQVGDEPALVQWITGCPVAVGADRVAAARCLLGACDVIVADDGLQHYALGRDIEIAVVDGPEGLGNGWPLPAGPLREPASRLRSVDFVAVRDGERAGAWPIAVRAGAARRVDGEDEARPLGEWHGEVVHAVAGIGVPERFFTQLELAGITIRRHPFPDHHAFARVDLDFGDERPVLMTQKDAVKCRAFNDPRLWYLAAEVTDRDGLADAVNRRLAELQPDRSA